MQNSGLIVFLPLVGAILGGFVGGIFGAWANSWFRDRAAKKAEDRERKGLWTLVLAEYRNNDATLTTLANHPSLLDDRTNLQTAVWDDTKVKLALLLPPDHVTALVRYYDQIQSTLDHINDEEMVPELKRGIVAGNAAQAVRYGKAAFSSKYVDQNERPDG